MIGKTISHYRIVDKLGGGGMGIVYKAEDTKLGRTVALKFLPPYISNDEESKRRFIHEAKAASALDHNNICNIHEIDETEDGQLFIVMAHYDGETLKQKLERGLVDIDESINIGIQIAEGLEKSHEMNITHRDIKPANIFIANDGVVKILDFGLAKISGKTQITRMSDTIGTVAYMSPEQTKGEAVDQRTDIWSLGVVLYEMITGELPFKGNYDQAVIYSIINEEYKPLESELSLFKRIIDKCLAKNPSDRYSDILELKGDLNELVVRSYSDDRRIFGTGAKSKSFYLSTAVLFFVTIVVFGYLFIPIGVNEKEKDITPEWENSIAVLPFEDMSPDGNQEWFCDGMTEQIITNLSRIGRLKVIARTSVIKFKDTKKTIPEIGKELDVTHILEGSIRKIDNKIRISTKLVMVKDGFSLWSDTYNKEFDDIFELQDRISTLIVESLLGNISQSDQQKIITYHPINVDAYEYYLKGEYYHKNFLGAYIQEDFDIAEKFLKKSIELDPNFALAYAGLSNLYHTYWDFGGHLDSSVKDNYLKLVHKNLDRALAINDKLPEIHLTNYSLVNDIEDKYNSIKLALKLNPNMNSAIFLLGRFYAAINLYEDAIDNFNRAIEKDPLNAFFYTKRGFSHYRANDFEKAESDFKKALEISPDQVIAMYHYIIMLIEQDRIEEAKEINNLLFKSNALNTWDFTKVLEAATGILKDPNQKYDSPLQMFMVYILMDMDNEAIELLEENLDEVFCWDYGCKYKALLNNQFCKKLQRYPRYNKLIEQEKLLYDSYVEKYSNDVVFN